MILRWIASSLELVNIDNITLRGTGQYDLANYIIPVACYTRKIAFPPTARDITITIAFTN